MYKNGTSPIWHVCAHVINYSFFLGLIILFPGNVSILPKDIYNIDVSTQGDCQPGMQAMPLMPKYQRKLCYRRPGNIQSMQAVLSTSTYRCRLAVNRHG